jgi:hypothetical protein
VFISITFRPASVSSPSLTFRRAAMRRWDRLLDSYIEEYRARGVSLQSVAYTEARLNRWGRWLKGRRPRVGIERIDAEMITRYISNCSNFRAKATVGARVAPIKIAYAFFKSDGPLPDRFFDYSKQYELQAVRDTRCDESVERFSYVKSVDHESGKPLPPTYVLKFLEGAPKDILNPDAVLPCYVLRPGKYRVLSQKKDGPPSAPTTR